MTEDRDPKLEAAYRALGAEEPPSALDDAILAAARRDAGARPGLPGRTGRQRWYAPVATAAVLVLAVATALNVQHEQPEIVSTAKLEVPAPVAANAEKESANAVGKAETRPELTASRSERDVRQEPRARKAPEAFPAASQDKPAEADKATAPAAPAAIASASAPPSPPAAAEALASRRDAARGAESGAAGALARQEQAPMQAQVPALEKRAVSMAEPKAAAAPPPSPARPAPLRDQVSVLTPEQDLERIAGLRKEQKHDEADKALAEFRKRHPEFRIPAPMLERVERR